MKSAYHVPATLAAVGLATLAFLSPTVPGRAAADTPTPTATPHLPADTAITAVVEANGGKIPASGAEVWAAVQKLGKFAQLPVPYSAVRIDSGIANPRVVIAPVVTGVSHADVNSPNVEGRLFLAANMEKDGGGGDPAVTSVEFISWNTTRRQFDFGVIDYMAGTGEPEIRIVDAGRCFTCHKNRGPILGAKPWSNTSHDDILRFATAVSLKLSGPGLPHTGPVALPLTGPGGVALRNRIDGMALTTPEAPAVDAAVRLGASLRTTRDAFRLMTRTPDGRKGLVLLLTAITEPGPLDEDDKQLANALNTTFDRSFHKFSVDWLALQKAAKPSALLDTDPSLLLLASGVRPGVRTYAPSAATIARIAAQQNTVQVSVPALVGGGGNGTIWRASPFRSPQIVNQTRTVKGPPPDPITLNAMYQASKAQAALNNFRSLMGEIAQYDAGRPLGLTGLTANYQPSNPRAFAHPPVKAPRRPSDAVNPVLLATAIGLTEGDRHFLADSLANAAKRVAQRKVTPASLAKEVFEGPRFADVLGGGPLPDRDDFKDRFVAGLDAVLRTAHHVADGFAPDRKLYASGPRFDPKLATAEAAAVVPTTACMRCHEVAGGGKKAPRFDPIPPLAFDPFNELGRAEWLKTAAPDQKRKVLARMVQRLVADADMPPEDAPEHALFRVKDPAAFDGVKRFLTAELAKVTKK